MLWKTCLSSLLKRLFKFYYYDLLLCYGMVILARNQILKFVQKTYEFTFLTISKKKKLELKKIREI